MFRYPDDWRVDRLGEDILLMAPTNKFLLPECRSTTGCFPDMIIATGQLSPSETLTKYIIRDNGLPTGSYAITPLILDSRFYLVAKEVPGYMPHDIVYYTRDRAVIVSHLINGDNAVLYQIVASFEHS